MAINLTAPSTNLQQFQSLTDYLHQLSMRREEMTNINRQQAAQTMAQGLSQAASNFGSGLQQQLAYGQQDKLQQNAFAQRAGFPTIGALSQAAQTAGGYPQAIGAAAGNMAGSQATAEIPYQQTLYEAEQARSMNLSVPQFQELRQKQAVIAQVEAAGQAKQAQMLQGMEQLISTGALPEPMRQGYVQARDTLAKIDTPEFAARFSPSEQQQVRQAAIQDVNRLASAARPYMPKAPSFEQTVQRGEVTMVPASLGGGMLIRNKSGMDYVAPRKAQEVMLSPADMLDPEKVAQFSNWQVRTGQIKAAARAAAAKQYIQERGLPNESEVKFDDEGNVLGHTLPKSGTDGVDPDKRFKAEIDAATTIYANSGGEMSFQQAARAAKALTAELLGEGAAEPAAESYPDLPRDMAQWKDGQVYQTARGPGRWNKAKGVFEKVE